MRTLIGILVILLLSAIYGVSSQPALREALGHGATSLVRPIAIPLVELINYPAFVYCAALAILLSGMTICVVHRFLIIGPAIRRLKRMRVDISNLPTPSSGERDINSAWIKARSSASAIFTNYALFFSGWSSFQSEAIRIGRVPNRLFQSFVASEPSEIEPASETMNSLPGYFTSVGLIFTFLGLVVALYFASKGFRTGDIDEAKKAIIQLLNAASFKFLTSVSALITAFFLSIYNRYSYRLLSKERERTLQRIEMFVATWRESMGKSKGGYLIPKGKDDIDLSLLIQTLASLSANIQKLVDSHILPNATL